MSDNCYREKINSLEDLKRNDIVIMDKETVSIKNNLLDIIKEKDLLPTDLAILIGISKQNLNYILWGHTIPNVSIALKLSYILDIPVDKLFELTPNLWVKQYTYNNKPLYLDILNLEILEYALVKQIIKSTGFEYYDIEEKKYFTKKNRDTLYKEYINQSFEHEVKKYTENNSNIYLRQAKSIVLKKLEETFNKRYIKIYNRLGQKITPYKV